MTELALEVTPDLSMRYLSRRLESYGFVASAWSAERLVAFQLFDQRRDSDVALTYLGPVFSKEGSYIFIFAALTRAHVESGAPFCLGMEFESDAAERALRRLLPRSAFPEACTGGVPEPARALARRFADRFDHIVGLDEDRLWTHMPEPMTPSTALRGHYQMMLVPCLTGGDRARILEELSAGLGSLRRHRARSGVVAHEGAVP